MLPEGGAGITGGYQVRFNDGMEAGQLDKGWVSSTDWLGTKVEGLR